MFLFVCTNCKYRVLQLNNLMQPLVGKMKWWQILLIVIVTTLWIIVVALWIAVGVVMSDPPNESKCCTCSNLFIPANQ